MRLGSSRLGTKYIVLHCLSNIYFEAGKVAFRLSHDDKSFEQGMVKTGMKCWQLRILEARTTVIEQVEGECATRRRVE